MPINSDSVCGRSMCYFLAFAGAKFCAHDCAFAGAKFCAHDCAFAGAKFRAHDCAFAGLFLCS